MTQTRNSGDSGYTWTDWQEQPSLAEAHHLAALESHASSHIWHVRTRARNGWYRIDEYRQGRWFCSWHEGPAWTESPPALRD